MRIRRSSGTSRKREGDAGEAPRGAPRDPRDLDRRHPAGGGPEGTPLGRAVKAVMEAGELVSDDTMIALIHERLADPDARDGFVLDGFPRTVAQASALERELPRKCPAIFGGYQPDRARGDARRAAAGAVGRRGARRRPARSGPGASARLSRENGSSGRVLPAEAAARRSAGSGRGVRGGGTDRPRARRATVRRGRHDHRPGSRGAAQARGSLADRARNPRRGGDRRPAGSHDASSSTGSPRTRSAGAGRSPPFWATGDTRRRSAPRSTTRWSTASRRAGPSRKGTSSGSTAAPSWTATTATRRGRSRSDRIAAERERLLRVTREALAAGIEAARPGNRVSDIGRGHRGASRSSTATASCATSSGTASGPRSTRSPRCPTTGRPDGARA